MSDWLALKHNNKLWHILVLGHPKEVLIATPVEYHSRWKAIEMTSMSGKQLFECKECGRISVAPDKWCVIGKSVNLTDLLLFEELPH
jgi:uncharacterized C2H2 Zn-finger protein